MESSSPPWRVFDSPGAQGSPAGDRPGATGPGDRKILTGSSSQVAIAGVAAALLIGGLAVVVAIAGAGGETIDGPAAATTAMPATGEPGFATGESIVEVSGAVVAPGLYHLAAGSRVGDAIEAAGGFSPRVDVDRVGAELNLAAAVVDGAQIKVPSRDDAAPTAGGSGGSGGGAGGGSGDTGGAALDLNTATKAELEALPGIGPVTADKIIAARTSEPFEAVDDLRARELVGEKTYEKIRPLLTVG